MFEAVLKNLSVLLSPQVMALVLLATSLLLFGGEDLIDTLGLRDFVETGRAYIGGAWLVSASGLAVRAFSWLARWSVRTARKLYWRMKRATLLDDLTPHECAVLAYFPQYQTKTARLDLGDGLVQGLVAKGIIFRASRYGELQGGRLAFDFRIADWAYTELLKEEQQRKLADKLSELEQILQADEDPPYNFPGPNYRP